MAEIVGFKKHRACGGNAGTVRDAVTRLRRAVEAPFDLQELSLNEDARREIHQGLVRAYSEKRSEVPAYASIRKRQRR